MQDKTILVTGATGHQGSTAVRHLLEAGFKVRGLTREPNKPEAKKLEELGANMVEGDLDNPDQIRRDLDGCYGVFAVLTWAEEGPAGEVKQGKILADAAKDVGIEHFLYSSVGGADRKTGIPHFESKWQNEQYMRQIGLPLTVLRPVHFMENFNQPIARKMIAGGRLVYPMDPNKQVQLISVEDIGFFGAIALDNKDDWLGKEVEIAGDSLKGPQMAQKFSEIVGHPVEYVEQPLQELKRVDRERFLLFSWMNESGYKADIEALRIIHPSLMTFDDWLRAGGWAGEVPLEEAPLRG